MALQRDLTPGNAFGITFSCVGVLWVFSRDPLYHAILNGGPVVCVWGWVGVSCLNIVTALCLAEMAECMPAAVGSLYVFTARLAPWHSRALATWVAAWANLAAAAGSTAYYALVITRTLASAARLARVAAATVPYDAADPSYALSRGQLLGCYVGVLLSWLALVGAPLRVTAGCITGASLWQVFGGVALFSSLLALSPRRRGIAFVLSSWRPTQRTYGIRSAPYNVLEGLLFPISAQTGYETVLYFVEEMLVHRRRRRARHRAPPPPAGMAAPEALCGARGMPPHRAASGQWPESGTGQGVGRLAAPPQAAAAAAPRAQSLTAAAAVPVPPAKLAAAGSASPGGGGGTVPTSGSAARLHAGLQRQRSGTAAAGVAVSEPAPVAAAVAPPAPNLGWATLYEQQRRDSAAAGFRGGGGGRSMRSASAVPESIYGGLAASSALSLLYLALLLAAAPSLGHAVEPRNETRGEDPMAQIVYDILRAAYGTGRGAPGLIAVLAVGSYGTGLVVAAGAARKLWAMAADGFVPPCFGRVSPTTGVPVAAAAAVTAAALAPGLLLLAGGDWAVGAALSFVQVAINASYLLPVALRLLPGSRAGYESGAARVGLSGGFTLGRASRPLFVVAAAWSCLSLLLVMLPPAWPPPRTAAPSASAPAGANWAPISSAALAAAVAASWWLPRPLGARHWFRGLASVGGVSFC